MTASGPNGAVRWGILGAANIARVQFLPGLREAGGGIAARLASRDRDRAEAFARDNGVDAGVDDYTALLESPDIDAVYVALPNSHHALWTERALQAGKAVLCEKPLCVGSEQTAEVLKAAQSSGALLWEAFVFPFQAQHKRLLALLGDGAVGEVRELISAFHFPLRSTTNIRLSAELGGGALADVGCYPIMLAEHILQTRDPGPDDVAGFGTSNGEVEIEATAIVDYGRQRLVLTCGFERSYDTFTRVLGDQGQIHLTNPFHPSTEDTLTIVPVSGAPIVEQPTTDQHTFSAMIRHIHGVLAGEAEPEHLAGAATLRMARTLEAVTPVCAR